MGLGLRVGLGLGRGLGRGLLGLGLGSGSGLAHCGHLVPRLRIATRARQAAREGRVGVPVAHRLVRSPALRVREVAAIHDEAGQLPPPRDVRHRLEAERHAVDLVVVRHPSAEVGRHHH